ncbi:hairy/enhancer-of-split related with YRPW motif protein 1-like [Lineus longissimus]|uniref:hairy/enhancer-of-split related with YRPW motif protein 1-like n=1 Tax=Lineus longissimus TaxID=88925 RepID=UPI002B4EC143
MVARMKRSLSESCSDVDEDVFDDMGKPGSPSQSCSVSDRKKRRGIIEKRRRDRINNSLSELRRLVPTAFEKQGSAKLEKAEILQMTVDHLKVLHQKGLNGNYYDPTSLAMDYRSVGFRECAAEVARYLVTAEGMDIQDPLRLRLMSHLQCFSAQRELATKACHQNTSWNSVPSHHGLNSQYGSSPATSMSSSMISQHNTQNDQLSMSHLGGMPPCTDTMARIGQSDSMTSLSNMPHNVRIPTTASVAPQMPNISTSSAQISHAQPLLPTLSQVHTQFPVSLSVNSMPMMSPSGHSYSPTTTSALHAAASIKPYRPWGAELAY